MKKNIAKIATTKTTANIVSISTLLKDNLLVIGTVTAINFFIAPARITQITAIGTMTSRPVTMLFLMKSIPFFIVSS